MNDKFENFIRAFTDVSTSDAYCNCGKHYFETEYLEGLGDVIRVQIEIDDNCIEVDCIYLISFMGKEYVEACDCWREQAEKLMAFIDSHKYKIVDYLNAEKERLINEANAFPEIKL